MPRLERVYRFRGLWDFWSGTHDRLVGTEWSFQFASIAHKLTFFAQIYAFDFLTVFHVQELGAKQRAGRRPPFRCESNC